MTTFDKREEGFEAKFALDETLRFKAEARRNKLLGLWAAEKLGKTRRGCPGICEVRGRSRLRGGGRRGCVPQDPRRFRRRPASTESDHQIRRTMTELMATAVQQVEAGT